MKEKFNGISDGRFLGIADNMIEKSRTYEDVRDYFGFESLSELRTELSKARYRIFEKTKKAAHILNEAGFSVRDCADVLNITEITMQAMLDNKQESNIFEP